MALVTDDLIFIHVQKTGGFSVRRFMHENWRCWESGGYQAHRHIGLPELAAEQPGIVSSRVSFGFVRHPVDWLRSRWRFMRATGYGVQVRHNPLAARAWMHDVWDDDFRCFVDKVLERYPGIVTQQMFHMLGLWTDTPVDIIMRTERMADDINGLLLPRTSGYRTEFRVPPQNVTKDDDGASMADRQIRRVLDAERALVERFYP